MTALWPGFVHNETVAVKNFCVKHMINKDNAEEEISY